MPAPLSDDDHKRRSRRRLIGAVALTIVAVIILPLVLEDEPSPAGPLDVRMPQPATDVAPQNAVEFAPPANALIEPVPEQEPAPRSAPKPAESPTPAPAKPAAQPAKETPKPVQAAVAYTVQVGVFSDKANAERLQSRITATALGHKPYTDQVGDSTRVRVGSFANRDEADALLAKLALAGITGGKVVEK